MILYTYIINRHAGTPDKTKTKYKMSLDCSSICFIGSRIGWVSMKEIYKSFLWYILTSSNYYGEESKSNCFSRFISGEEFNGSMEYYVFCVFCSHSFWTSSSLDVPAGVTQEESHTGFFIRLPSAVRALIFLARRIQPFLSPVDREVEIICVLTI